MATCIEKLGTIDIFIVEANPFVFSDRLYRIEYIRYKSEIKKYRNNHKGHSYFRIIDVEKNAIISEFGDHLHMGNAFVDPLSKKVIVTAVEDWGKNRFYQMESTDLINWSSPKVIIEGENFAGYNTTMCMNDRHEYVLCFELGAPEELVGEPFTMFFAVSKDLKNYQIIPDAIFGKDFYTGGPMLRFFAPYYYLFYVDGSYEKGFNTFVSRSKNLRNWEFSRQNPVLNFDKNDRKVFSGNFNKAELEKIKNAVNINASDLDMCNYRNHLYFTYAWGDQKGNEFLAAAEAAGNEQQFCESFFKDNL